MRKVYVLTEEGGNNCWLIARFSTLEEAEKAKREEYLSSEHERDLRIFIYEKE